MMVVLQAVATEADTHGITTRLQMLR
jgi:hypothetical protein